MKEPLTVLSSLRGAMVALGGRELELGSGVELVGGSVVGVVGVGRGGRGGLGGSGLGLVGGLVGFGGFGGLVGFGGSTGGVVP